MPLGPYCTFLCPKLVFLVCGKQDKVLQLEDVPLHNGLTTRRLGHALTVTIATHIRRPPTTRDLWRARATEAAAGEE